MKKTIVIMAVFAACANVFAQKIVRTETLKTTDLGNQKLVVASDGESEAVFAVKLKTGNRFQPYIVVALGNKENSIRLLTFLAEADIKAGDVLSLENETNNVAVWNMLGGYTIYSEGRALNGHLRKQNIRGFIKEIEKY